MSTYLNDKLLGVRASIEAGRKEDALKHLFDLINMVAPNYILRKGDDQMVIGIQELKDHYGDEPSTVVINNDPLYDVNIWKNVKLWQENDLTGPTLPRSIKDVVDEMKPAHTLEATERQIEQLESIKSLAVAASCFEFAAEVRQIIDEFKDNLAFRRHHAKLSKSYLDR